MQKNFRMTERDAALLKALKAAHVVENDTDAIRKGWEALAVANGVKVPA